MFFLQGLQISTLADAEHRHMSAEGGEPAPLATELIELESTRVSAHRRLTPHRSVSMLSRRARSAFVVRLLTVPRGVLVRREISLCERPWK